MNPIEENYTRSITEFITLQMDAVREDPDMPEAMYEAVRQSLLDEAKRLIMKYCAEALEDATNRAFDEGYIKALTHTQQRRGGAVVKPEEVLKEPKYRLGSLKVVGQQLNGIPRKHWDAVHNAARQLKFRLGRQFHFTKDEERGLMTVTLMRVEPNALVDVPKMRAKAVAQMMVDKEELR